MPGFYAPSLAPRGHAFKFDRPAPGWHICKSWSEKFLVAQLDAPCAPCSRVGCVLRTTPSTGGILGSRPGGPWQAAKGPNGHRQPFPLFPFSPFPLFPFSPFRLFPRHSSRLCWPPCALPCYSPLVAQASRLCFPCTLVGRASGPASFRPKPQVLQFNQEYRYGETFWWHRLLSGALWCRFPGADPGVRPALRVVPQQERLLTDFMRKLSRLLIKRLRLLAVL